MHCPHDHSPLREIDYEGALVHTCESCGGEFIDGETMQHILQTREERFPADLRGALLHQTPSFGAPRVEEELSFSCPRCAGDMDVVNYAGDTGVIVDRCGKCGGLWLDHEELEHVQVLSERWADEAPEQIRGIAGELEERRREAVEKTHSAFTGSRFAFVNAVINCFLDAA